jgi:hypothetical protein
MLKNTLIIRFLFLFLVIFLCQLFQANSQIRIAVMPFQNMEGGAIERNQLCYDFQDTLIKLLKEQDKEEKYYRIVPADSIELVLTSLNLDPVNPQYPSDMWKAIKSFNVQKVVTGNFNIQYNKILINAYIVDSRTKLPDQKNQVRDIFLPFDKAMESLPTILNGLLPALIPKK